MFYHEDNVPVIIYLSENNSVWFGISKNSKGWLSVTKNYRDFEVYESSKTVGCRLPNDYGLYDMFGSCQELTNCIMRDSDGYLKVLTCDVSESFMEDPCLFYNGGFLISALSRAESKAIRLFRTVN